MSFNPFMIAMAALNIASAGWYFHVGNAKLAGITVCYAVSSAILATL